MIRLEIEDAILPGPVLHNGAQGKPATALSQMLRHAIPWGRKKPVMEVSTAAQRWSNALSYTLSAASLLTLAAHDALVIECLVEVHDGALGMGVLSADGTTYASIERTAAAGEQPIVARLWVRDPSSARQVMFRNVASGARSTRFDLLGIRAYRVPHGREFHASWSSPQTSAIPVDELRQAIAWAGAVWGDPFPSSMSAAASGTIEIVDAGALPTRLGSSIALELPEASQTKALPHWKMESDDAPILEWLWRSRAPRRHLEFGTWEGFGATLVAGATDAEIWTINLPEGEATNDGSPLYALTDAGTFIGHLYREAGFENRVHQVLCDSRNLDIGQFQGHPFDSILIDGGHTPDVVRSDTDMALRVLRPGGICVWHDFCPDPETLSQNLAPLGVVQAVAESFNRWSAAFQELFWIRKSWILVGIRRS